MSRLQELLEELCPNGVEYRKLKDVSVMQRGTSLTKANATEGEIPVISGGREPAFYCDRCNRDGETITVAGSGAGAGYVQYWNEPIYANDCFTVKGIQGTSTKYLYYFMSNIQDKISDTKKGGGVPHVHISDVENFRLPVPPLEVQCEIVRVLDSFTLLTDELTDELTARKKQYEYYRDSLLAFDENVPRKSIGEIALDIYRGAGIKRDEVTSEGIPCVRYGEIYTSYDISFTECKSHTSADVVSSPKYFEHGDIIFTITGESVEDIAKSIVYLGHEKCMAGGDTVVLKHELEPRYLSYALSTTDARRQKSAGKVKSKVVHSSVPALKEIVIPVPSYEEQKRIADILDSFHYLVNDISEGIPAEIEVRKKQYEYYRDKLLSFKDLGA